MNRCYEMLLDSVLEGATGDGVLRESPGRALTWGGGRIRTPAERNTNLCICSVLQDKRQCFVGHCKTKRRIPLDSDDHTERTGARN